MSSLARILGLLLLFPFFQSPCLVLVSQQQQLDIKELRFFLSILFTSYLGRRMGKAEDKIGKEEANYSLVSFSDRAEGDRTCLTQSIVNNAAGCNNNRRIPCATVNFQIVAHTTHTGKLRAKELTGAGTRETEGERERWYNCQTHTVPTNSPKGKRKRREKVAVKKWRVSRIALWVDVVENWQVNRSKRNTEKEETTDNKNWKASCVSVLPLLLLPVAPKCDPFFPYPPPTNPQCTHIPSSWDRLSLWLVKRSSKTMAQQEAK